MGMTRSRCDNGSYDFCKGKLPAKTIQHEPTPTYWMPAIFNHRPQYHHGLSKRRHIRQETGDWILAYYGGPRYSKNRIPCYGMPREYCWPIKDRIDGPRSLNYRRFLRRLMRKRARREGKQLLRELEQECFLYYGI